MPAKCKIIGLSQVEMNFETLAKRAPEKLAALVQKALEQIALLARIMAPRRSGRYAASIQARMGEKKNNPVGFVAPWSKREGRISRIGHLVEFGTAPHAVGKGSQRVATVGETLTETKTGKLRWKKVKGTGNQTGNMHPGAPAKPHLFPAFKLVIADLKAQIAAAIQESGAFR